jgi:dienelactone hydrolase
MSRLRFLLIGIALTGALTVANRADAADVDLTGWPEPDRINATRGETVSYPSHSPFTLWEVGKGEALDPPTQARATLFMPERASAETPVPAVVLLHGAAGVLSARELTYGAQFAKMGVAALVVDTFGSRRDRGTGFVERLLQVTETMLIADAYAGLRYLDAMPGINGNRVALMGFSYGGLSTMLAAFEQTAQALSPDGLRFAAHVSFYGPCLARFDNIRATGAPVLLLAGSEDAIVDPGRCNEVIADLREGGTQAEFVIYEGAYHQWDGRRAGPRTIGRNLAPCEFNVNARGVARDTFTFLPMSGPFLRKLILGACVGSEGYLIGRDDNVRALSNQQVGTFLMRAFNGNN